MAKIVHSSLAPSEAVTYSLGNASFEIDGSKKTAAYETDDPTVIADARAHPWLDVIIPKADQVEGFIPERLDPTKDPLSAQHPDALLALNPDAMRAALVKATFIAPQAIDAGLDQDKLLTDGPVAKTLAADEAAVDKAEAKIEAAEKDTTTSKEKK